MTRPSSPLTKILPHDKGCRLANSCLNCPLPFCLHDPDVKQARNNEIHRQYFKERVDIDKLEHRFGVSKGTIKQIIAKRVL